MTLLNQRYEVQSQLGVGVMGVVYRGMDNHTGQPVAIKKLRADLATPDVIARFVREGEALRQLNHPNIVKMLDALQDKGNYYLIMELVEGGSLEALVAQPMAITRLLPIGLDVADALTRAHRLNIIHRD